MALAQPRHARRASPDDVAIVPRDLRFGRADDYRQLRWWVDDDPYASAFFNALSVTFPRSEAFFIASVNAMRDGVDGKLADDIRAFAKQEVMHSREHLAFNGRTARAGYDLTRLEALLDGALRKVQTQCGYRNLAATMAMEHFTAIIAHEHLTHDVHLGTADQEAAEMWRWHAREEIEHKAIAFDVWLHATRGWSRWRRWWLKARVMTLVATTFVPQNLAGMIDLLRQDGITGLRARLGLYWYAFGYPGPLRRVTGGLIAYFLPGFHPWNRDDRHLLENMGRNSPYLAAAE